MILPKILALWPILPVSQHYTGARTSRIRAVFTFDEIALLVLERWEPSAYLNFICKRHTVPKSHFHVKKELIVFFSPTPSRILDKTSWCYRMRCKTFGVVYRVIALWRFIDRLSLFYMIMEITLWNGNSWHFKQKKNLMRPGLFVWQDRPYSSVVSTVPHGSASVAVFFFPKPIYPCFTISSH
jgi:hypothetical protein